MDAPAAARGAESLDLAAQLRVYAATGLGLDLSPDCVAQVSRALDFHERELARARDALERFAEAQRRLVVEAEAQVEEARRRMLCALGALVVVTTLIGVAAGFALAGAF